MVCNSILESNISSACGEYYVISQLLRNGFEAYLSHGNTQKYWDIVVYLDHRKIKIQVKTVQWKDSSKTVQCDFTIIHFDFLVIVVLNHKNEHQTYQDYDSLIIPKSNLIEKKEDKKLFSSDGDICYKNKTITLNLLYDEENNEFFKRYINKWEKIKEGLK